MMLGTGILVLGLIGACMTISTVNRSTDHTVINPQWTLPIDNFQLVPMQTNINESVCIKEDHGSTELVGDVCLEVDEHLWRGNYQCPIRVPWLCQLTGGDPFCAVCLHSIYVWSCKGVLVFTLLAFRRGTLLGFNMVVSHNIEKDPLLAKSERGIITVLLLGELIFGSLCAYWLFLLLLIQLNGGRIGDVLDPLSQFCCLMSSYGVFVFSFVITAHVLVFENIHHVIFPRMWATEVCGCDTNDLRDAIEVDDHFATSQTVNALGFDY